MLGSMPLNMQPTKSSLGRRKSHLPPSSLQRLSVCVPSVDGNNFNSAADLIVSVDVAFKPNQEPFDEKKQDEKKPVEIESMKCTNTSALMLQQ